MSMEAINRHGGAIAVASLLAAGGTFYYTRNQTTEIRSEVASVRDKVEKLTKNLKGTPHVTQNELQKVIDRLSALETSIIHINDRLDNMESSLVIDPTPPPQPPEPAFVRRAHPPQTRPILKRGERHIVAHHDDDMELEKLKMELV